MKDEGGRMKEKLLSISFILPPSSFILHPSSFRLPPSSLHYRAVFDGRVLGHEDDAVAYVVAAVGTVQVLDSLLVDQAHALSDARILVYDGAVNDCAGADAYARDAGGNVCAHVIDGGARFPSR